MVGHLTEVRVPYRHYSYEYSSTVVGVCRLRQPRTAYEIRPLALLPAALYSTSTVKYKYEYNKAYWYRTSIRIGASTIPDVPDYRFLDFSSTKDGVACRQPMDPN